jgi:hypothetical protein
MWLPFLLCVILTNFRNFSDYTAISTPAAPAPAKPWGEAVDHVRSISVTFLITGRDALPPWVNPEKYRLTQFNPGIDFAPFASVHRLLVSNLYYLVNSLLTD